MKTYTLKLIDTCTNEYNFYEVGTNKSLKTVERIYKKARKDWYEMDTYCSLIEYIVEQMDKAGIIFYDSPVEPDLELDF